MSARPELPLLASFAQRVVLRTGRGPLAGVWSAVYRCATQAVAAHLLRRRVGAAYLRGSFAEGDPVYGLSDVDLVLVLPDADPPGRTREEVRRRWRRLQARLPLLANLVSVAVYEDADLLDAAARSSLTYALDHRPGEESRSPAVYHGNRPLDDELGLRQRPGLYEHIRTWRLLRGADLRPHPAPRQEHERHLAAWLELQYWWAHAFLACAYPERPFTSYLCVKLVSEPARIWLWLEHNEKITGRERALERARRLLPEEEETLATALRLERALASSPAPPVDRVVPWLLRISARIASRLGVAARDAGATVVRLDWLDEPELLVPERDRAPLRPLLPPGDELRLLPLGDWVARVTAQLPDESVAVIPGDPGDPGLIAAAAPVGNAGPHPLLQAADVVVLPTGERWRRAQHRAVQCAVTDPVTFSLLEERRVASFPDLPGWSACDSARRAIAEHLAWLEADLPGEPGHRLARLFTAARAALFLDSLEAGDPALPLTVATTAALLERRDDGAGDTIEKAHSAYRAWRLVGEEPAPTLVDELRALVLALPPYSGLR